MAGVPFTLHLVMMKNLIVIRCLSGIFLGEEFVVYSDVSVESGQQATEQLLGLHERPDAIFAVEDFTALGAIQKLKSRGIAIPEQFGIIGFANEAFSAYITPSLSTIDQQTKKMGEVAAALFLEMTEKKNTNAY